MGNHEQRAWTGLLSVAAMGAMMVAGVHHVVSGEITTELSFASGLIERGFPDYAEDVINAWIASNPGREEDVRGVRAELLLAQRKFDEALRIVESIPAGTNAGRAIRIKLANAYSRSGDVEQAKRLYEQFFEQFKSPPTELEAAAAYRDAALYETAMLEGAENYGRAAESMERLVAAAPDLETKRAYLDKLAKLLIKRAMATDGAVRKKALDRVEEVIRDVEFGGPFWVSQAVLLRADAARAKGDPGKALEILEQSRTSFARIDASLSEAGAPLSQSPRAGYYYLRGAILAAQGSEQAERLSTFGDPGGEEAKGTLAKALNSFATVLKKYPESDYATDAALGLKATEDILIAKGAQIQRSAAMQQVVPKHADELFRSADALFRKGQYQNAQEEYLRVLNQFPETPASPRALTQLAKAYAKLDDELLSRLVMEYLAERFAGQTEAGRGCLILASFYGKEKRAALRLAAFEAFAEYFPQDPKAAQVLYTVALVRKRSGDEAASLDLLKKLIARYASSSYALKSLMALAVDAYKAKRFESARAVFDQYGSVAPEGLDRAKALILAADCRMRLGDYAEAFKAFRAVASALDPSDPSNPYYVDKEQQAAIRKIHQQALFQQAFSLSQVEAPAETKTALLENVLTLYDQFLTAFGAAPLAPKAMAAKGGVLLQLDRMDLATTTFETLARTYPDTPEGKSSLFTLVEAAVKVGKLDVATDAVDRMAGDPESYGAAMFARVGQLMLESSMHAQAIRAFETMLQASQDPALKERGYFGLGASYFETGDCESAIRRLEALIELNHRTGYLFDARLLMAKAYRQCRRYPEAIESLRDIFAMDRDAVRLQQANFELALIQELQGRAADAYASYLRMGLNPDPTREPELMDINRQATLKAVSYSMERSDWDTVVLLADQFARFWPDDEQGDAVQQQKRQALLEKATEMPAEPSQPSG
jgi:tetratricopeptide (TPR) repeat protein